MKLEVGKRYTIKDTYNKPNGKYFRGVPKAPVSALRGKTFKCFKLSATGLTAWFNYNGEKFWVKALNLTEAPKLPKTRKIPRVRLKTPKLKGTSFLITKPEKFASAFWVPNMDQYVGQVAVVIEEGQSKWVRVHVDGGGYMWNKDWLKPFEKETMKVRKLTLQEELAAIDAKYDSKIRSLRYRSNARQNEIARKANDYKDYLARDKTTENVDKYITSLKYAARAPEPRATWKAKKVAKVVAGAIAISSVVGVSVYGLLSLL